MIRRLSALCLLLSVVCIAGCGKRPAAAPGIVTAAAISAELAPTFVTVDDARYSPLDHAWLERALARHLAQTWQERPYAPELKDCDDFTDFLVSNVRHWFGEQAPAGSGGALVGRYSIYIAEANAWHRVALVRTDRGWFVADPLALVPHPWRIPLIPLADYRRPARLASF